MFSVTGFRYSFTSTWTMLSLAVLSTIVLMSLGVWQLHRASEKRALLAQYHHQLRQIPIPFPGRAAQQYQPVRVEGVSQLAMVFLLDNQHHGHQIGYDVLTPLRLADDTVVLIDHGWVPGDPSRSVLPNLSHLPTSLSYLGQIYYPTRHPFTLGTGLEAKTPDLTVIETLDLPMISHFLHKSVYPFIIRQSPEPQSKWVRDWPIVASSPIRHIGYAIQWFFFALGVVVMYLKLHIKRRV
jgi:surfeit locus 1 family protein